MHIITCVIQTLPFSFSHDRWGASPEFSTRRAAAPWPPPHSVWDMYVRGQDDRFSPPQFPVHSVQHLPELSGLRPTLCPHVTYESNLVFFCPLGYFPSQTFSFSSYFIFTQEGSSQGCTPIVPNWQLSQWSFLSGMPSLPDTAGCESKARQTHSPCGVLTSWHHGEIILSLHFPHLKNEQIIAFLFMQ